MVEQASEGWADIARKRLEEIERLESELASRLSQQSESSDTDIDPIELTNQLNALLGKGRPPKTQLAVKDVRKILRDLRPE